MEGFSAANESSSAKAMEDRGEHEDKRGFMDRIDGMNRGLPATTMEARPVTDAHRRFSGNGLLQKFQKVSAPQASKYSLRELPGPALGELAPTQAINCQAFSREPKVIAAYMPIFSSRRCDHTLLSG